jgi:gluconolactonase
MNRKFIIHINPLMILFPIMVVMVQCVNGPKWQEKNDELITQHNLAKRELAGLPESLIRSNLNEEQVKSLDSIGTTQLYPGVNANIFWGSGITVARLQLEPNAEISEEVLPADKFLFVIDGSIDQLINGSKVNMIGKKREEPDGIHSGTPRTDFVYLLKGSKSALKAGTSGATLLELHSPARLDYLQKSGYKDLPIEIADVATTEAPNVEANFIYDLYDIQLFNLAPGAHSRLISGRNMQLSFISMDPNSVFPYHIHPEEQMMLILRGGVDETLLDRKQSMKVNDVIRIPGNMVHLAEIGEEGADVLDIFWPVRTDYLEKEKAAMAAYRTIIPRDAKLELVVDGKKTNPELNFAEGPKWMNGKVYFSNMYFDKDFNADPKKSSTVELDPSGSYKNITEGKMQTNGLYPYKNGNLIVCDMMGHRVVAMTTKGQVVKVLADKFEGKPIDGPNDVVVDRKGGFYFTDPQFTMEANKFQPGRAVYYVSPAGKIIRVTEPNEFAMPNGIVLSPDGKNLYINNCYDNETWYPVDSEKDNFIWAYDVNEDGTITNGRKFAELRLTGEVLDRKGRSSSADGMAIDQKGNLYVATYYGVQIFNSKGDFVGIINLPSFPVSLCFGDEDMKTLYIVSYSKVYKIRTNMEGFVQYL